MTNYSTTHQGLERVLNGTDTLVHAVGPAKGMRLAPTLVLTGIVSAVLAVAVRVFDDLLTQGFTQEWLALWLLASITVFVFGRVAFLLGDRLANSERGLIKRWKAAQAEREMMRLAAADPRVMADIRAAIDRSQW